MVRPALLWNDTRSAGAAADLIDELGGGDGAGGPGRTRSGIVPVASFTVTKLRWLARNEPENAARVGRGLPAARLADLEAGRGAPAWTRCAPTAATPAARCYWSAATGEYRPDLLELGVRPARSWRPEVLGPTGTAGHAAQRRPARPGRRRQRRRRRSAPARCPAT